MRSYFVGQPVRIVFSPDPLSANVGRECRIIGRDEDSYSDFVGHYSGWLLNVTNRYGFVVCARADWIEPIVPEGMQPVAWEDAADLWGQLGLLERRQNA